MARAGGLPPGAPGGVRREVAESAAQLARVPLGRIANDGVAPFNVLRRAVLHAATGREGSLEELLGDVEDKSKVLSNLVVLHEEKRIYRKQVAAVITVLLQVDSWQKVLTADEALRGRLPEDLRAVIGGEDPAAAGAVEAAATPVPPAPAAPPLAPGGNSPAAGADSPSARAALAATPQLGPRSAPARAAPAQAVGAGPALSPAAADALQRELGESARQIATLRQGADGSEAFNLLRRGVVRASTAREVGMELLQDLEPKAAILKFLVAFHEQKRMYRKQTAAVFQILLQARGWLRALRGDNELWGQLHEELRAIEAQAVEPPEPPAAAAEATAEEEPTAASEAAAAGPPTPADAQELEVTVTFSELLEGGTRLRVNNDEVRAAIEAAKGRLAKAPAWSPLRKDAQQALSSAQFQIELLMKEAASPRRGSDEAITAFEDFRRATVAATAALLDAMEPKAPILEFLLALNESKKKYRSRIAATLAGLLRHEAWRAAVDEDPKVQEAVRCLLEDVGGMVSRGGGSAVNVKKKAAEVIASGGAGILCVRVIAAYNLINQEAHGRSDPYVRVTVGGKSRQTPSVFDDRNPMWNATPFVFEVPAGAAKVKLEVMDRNYNEDARMGFVEVKAASTQELLGQGPKRHPLSGVQQGELEVELTFEGEPEEEEQARQEAGPEVDQVQPEGEPEEEQVQQAQEPQGKFFGLAEILEQAISMLAGSREDGDAVVIFDHSELRCPHGHPVSKRKEGLRWHQACEFWVQQRCNLCNDVINAGAARWRCRHHCDFDVCEACYDDVHSASQPAAVERAPSFFSIHCGSSSAGMAGATQRSSSLSSFLRRGGRLATPSGAGGGGGGGGGAAVRSSSSSRASPGVQRTALGSRQAGPYGSCLEPESPTYDSSFCMKSVSIPPDAIVKLEDVVYFGVDVTPDGGEAPWRVLRRYNDFSGLADRLGKHARSFSDAPFPSKHLFGYDATKQEERRLGLEVWLRRVLRRRPVPLVWLRPLKDFLQGPEALGRTPRASAA